MPRTVPILLYHSVSDNPAHWISRFTVTPRAFADQLDAVAASGATPLTVSRLIEGRNGGSLPERPVLVTFDDGFADTREAALPELARRGIAATVYVTTGFLEQGSWPQGSPMLDGAALRELAQGDVEVGGHSHTHPQLDTLTRNKSRDELRRCKSLLEDALSMPVRSFAYPHGYSSAAVRRQVQEEGFDSACGVGNALSHDGDDAFHLARLMVRATTTTTDIAAWVAGSGAPLAPRREAVKTRLWRSYRRLSVRAGWRPTVDL